MQQQQPQQLISNPMMSSSFPPANITTDQIQKFLDENKQLILAIMNNQNLGKLAECAQYQALLQKNLLYLAAIADAQPPPTTPTPIIPAQMSLGRMQQQGGFYQQLSPATLMSPQQQPSGFAHQVQFNNNNNNSTQPQMGVRPSHRLGDAGGSDAAM